MEQLLETARAMRNLCVNIMNNVDDGNLDQEKIEQYFHDLETGDYSLMSALHQAWHEAKTPTNTGEITQ